LEAFVLEMGREVFKIVVPAQLGSKDLIGAKGILNSELGGKYDTCKK